MKNSLRIKSVSEIKEDSNKSHLKKEMGVFQLIMLGLGAIIGTGIFVLTGLAAAKYAGPAITLSFMLGAVACIFTALAFAELAAMIPTSGSAYAYAYATIGEVGAALIGWTVLMIYSFGAATVAAGWSGYVLGMLSSLGIALPEYLTRIPAEGGLINLPAFSIVLVISTILVRGNEGLSKLNGILVFIKIFVILLFITVAIPDFKPENWTPFAPLGFFGVAAGASFVFMAYTGFDTLATAAEECRNPNRDLPIGIVASLLGSAFLYVVVAGLLTGIVPYTDLNNSEPMAYALRVNGSIFSARLVALGAIAGMTSVILTQIFGQSRILMVMSRDGIFPALFSKIHKKYATPYVGILASGFVIATIAGFLPVATLGQLTSMATLEVFLFVSVAVMILRRKIPNEPRPFRCPAIYLIASLSTLLCGFLFVQLIPENWMPYLMANAIGLVLYSCYGYHHSVLGLRRKNS